MVTKVQKWGNSQGLRLNKQVLETARIRVGEEVVVSARRGRILISPASRIRGSKNLKELLAKIPEGYEPKEEAWGRPAGREVW